MRLKRLELCGFKSFFDKTSVHFKPGVTAIVGPNGCGKSNLIDAVLWVLGEQRPKALRGDKMEDVIFNGTEDRKPLGMAEVSLTVDDLRDPLPPIYSPYSEITFTRRLHRSGESEYFINQVSCRLKDIRELLMDMRGGSHAIIEQGRLDDLLMASPIARRELVEEVAGISKYRVRKEEATRKLAATQQNLTRIQDILSEVKRQINMLDRQARAAQKYKLLYEELKAYEVYLGAVERQMFDAREKALLEEERLLRDRITQQEAEAATLDLKATTLQQELSEKEIQLATHRDHLADKTGQIGKCEGQIERLRAQKKEWREMEAKVQSELSSIRAAHAARMEEWRQLQEDRVRIGQERHDVEEQFAQVDREATQIATHLAQTASALEKERTEIFDLASHVTAARNNLLHYDARQNTLLAGREEAIRRITESAQKKEVSHERLDQLQREADQRDADIAALRERQEQGARLLAEIEARKKKDEDTFYQLKEDEARQSAARSSREGFYKGRLGVSYAAEMPLFPESSSLVADLLDVPQPYEKAIEAILGERVRGRLVNDLQQLQEAIRQLHTLKKGRGVLILRDPFPSWDAPALFLESDLPEGVIGSAFSLVSCKTGFESVVKRLLEGFYIVRDMETACRQMADRGPLEMVTLEGELFCRGVVSVSAGDEEKSLFHQKRELTELTQDVQQLQEQVKQQMLEIEKDKNEYQASQSHQEQILTALKEQEAQRALLQNEIHAVSMEKERQALTYQTLSDEQEADRQECAALEQRMSEEQRTMAALCQRHSEKEQQWTEAFSEQKNRETHYQAVKEKSVGLQLTLTALLEKERHAREKQETAEQAIKSLAAREENQAAYDVSLQARFTDAERETKEIEQTIETLRLDQERLTETIRKITEAHDQCAQTFESLRGQVRQAQSNKEQSVDALHQTSVRLLETKMAREKLCEAMLAQYQTDLTSVDASTLPFPEKETDPSDGTLPDTASETWARLCAARDQRRTALSGMTPVHFGVIDEYQELLQRHDFLKNQANDLTASMDDLKAAIGKIHQTTNGLFRTTFQQLNKNFGEAFAFFFGGGKAELILDPPEDLAESGISILAAPSGKKPKTLNLLSGGEKALTGLSLLFSMFMTGKGTSPGESDEAVPENGVVPPETVEASEEAEPDPLPLLARAYPFCFLDEVDAALDEANARRFADALERLSHASQFIVVTHNKQTMQKADVLYGVTADQPGISRLISVSLRDLVASPG